MSVVTLTNPKEVGSVSAVELGLKDGSAFEITDVLYVSSMLIYSRGKPTDGKEPTIILAIYEFDTKKTIELTRFALGRQKYAYQRPAGVVALSKKACIVAATQGESDLLPARAGDLTARGGTIAPKDLRVKVNLVDFSIASQMDKFAEKVAKKCSEKLHKH